MFCENCGKQIPDGSAFCEHCGTKMESAPAPIPNTTPAAAAVPAKKPVTFASVVEKVKGIHKKNKLIFPIAGAVVLIALVVAIVLGILGKQVSVKNYLKITMEGYDGYGRMTYSFNDMAFGMRAAGDKDSVNFDSYDDKNFLSLDQSDVSKDYRKKLASAQRLVDSIEVSYELPEGKTSDSLTNGDVIQFTVTYKESIADDLGLTLKDATFEYTVEGLDPISQLDVLSYFDLGCEGYDGYGIIKLACNQTGAKEIGDLTFQMETGESRIRYEYKNGYSGWIYAHIDGDTYNMSNGDIVTVTVNMSADSMVEGGVELTGLTKEYTVSGLKESQIVDLLKYYNVVFTGVEGAGRASFEPTQETLTVGEFTVDLKSGEWTKNGEYLGYTRPYLDKSYNLNTGDEIKFCFKPSQSTFGDIGIKFSATEKTYTVSGLGKYLTGVTEIKDSADFQAAAIQKVSDALNDSWGRYVHDTYWGSFSNQKIGDDMKLYKTIVTTPKSSTASTKNTLYMIFSVTISDNKITTPTVYYFAISQKNVVVYPDGKIACDGSFTMYAGNTSYDTLYNTKIDSYNLNITVSE